MAAENGEINSSQTDAQHEGHENPSEPDEEDRDCNDDNSEDESDDNTKNEYMGLSTENLNDDNSSKSSTWTLYTMLDGKPRYGKQSLAFTVNFVN